MHAGKCNLRVNSKLAGVQQRESIRIHDEYEEWMRVFESIVQLLDNYGHYPTYLHERIQQSGWSQ